METVNWADYESGPAKRKNPMVMVGCLVTAGVLFAGLVAFKKGHQDLSQKMMRARVIAQGATVALMLGSTGYYALQTPPEAGVKAGPQTRPDV